MARTKVAVKKSAIKVANMQSNDTDPGIRRPSKRGRKPKQTRHFVQEIQDTEAPIVGGKIIKGTLVKDEPGTETLLEEVNIGNEGDVVAVETASEPLSKRGKKSRTMKGNLIKHELEGSDGSAAGGSKKSHTMKGNLIKHELEESDSSAVGDKVTMRKNRSVTKGSAKRPKRPGTKKVRFIKNHENEVSPSDDPLSITSSDPGSEATSRTVKKRGPKRPLSSEESKTTITAQERDTAKPNEKGATTKKKRKATVGPGKGEALMTNVIAEKVRKAANASKKMLGAHVSAAGGLENAVYNAVQMGCRAFALFLRNQRTWNAKPLEQNAVEQFKAAVKEHSFSLDQVVPHGSYLINLGSADEEVLRKSRQAMLDECQRCERLGIPIYNIHPGSAAGKHSADECIRTVAASIDYVLERTSSVIIVVETMAGQGSTVGGSFEELRSIIDHVNNRDRIGVCIDTCHIFAAGYDIRTKETYQKTMDHFEKIIGFNYLKAVHLNDSKGGLGSKLDRHENIGNGKLRTAFKYLMSDKRFDGIPMVLETPEGDYAGEMIRLYSKTD